MRSSLDLSKHMLFFMYTHKKNTCVQVCISRCARVLLFLIHAYMYETLIKHEHNDGCMQEYPHVHLCALGIMIYKP